MALTNSTVENFHPDEVNRILQKSSEPTNNTRSGFETAPGILENQRPASPPVSLSAKSVPRSSVVNIYGDLSEFDDPFDPRRLSTVEKTFDPNVVDVGAIDLAFPENPDPKFSSNECFPTSYYTLSPKERLLLLFVENFRRQFVANAQYANRRPLVLAVKNECDVQKFVCTTIRPTPFVFLELIGNWQECASFVADFITYEHLEHPLCIPPRLISPDTLLRLRRGNSYEMATLLCSMLTGAGFAAMVVSGIATKETTLNDQRRVPCPFIPSEREDDDVAAQPKQRKNKYELRKRPDLRSRFLTNLEERALEEKRLQEERRLKEQTEKEEELARKPVDQFMGRRMHAWVAIIENAPWCYKPRQHTVNDEGETSTSNPKAFFIEPTTGLRREVSSRNYLQIDCVWNQYNYYINRQESTENGLQDMKWDFKNAEHWEHLLPAEPYEIRDEQSPQLDADPESILIEKHLDVIPSWVRKLYICDRDFEERFPNCEKAVHYKKTLYQRYSPYFKNDGLVKKLTMFEDWDYCKPILRWEWYDNRMDFLQRIKIDFRTKQIEESFVKGRPDCLKQFVHNANPELPKMFNFYHRSRVDCLKSMEITSMKFTYHYEMREDFVYYQEFQSRKKGRTKSLSEIVEKCHRNEMIAVSKDVSVRQFRLAQNSIFLKFQYAKDAITRSTREFVKPPKPDYGEEIIFDPALTTGYHANPLEKLPTQVELYDQLLKELRREEILKKLFDQRCVELDELLTRRKTEMLNPRLHFSVFDKLRNEGARKIRMEEYEENRLRLELARLMEPDYLAPYLVLHDRRKPNYEESWAAYKDCLKDVKAGYANLLNELQRRYRDLASEAKALRKFMMRFQDQLDEADYGRLTEEAKNIEMNKRAVQQRLLRTHAESQRKYDKIKERLLKDERLNLKEELVE